MNRMHVASRDADRNKKGLILLLFRAPHYVARTDFIGESLLRRIPKIYSVRHSLKDI